MNESGIHLALLWHMHQPSYREPDGDGFALPWVRLHSTRAYFDMAWILERHPTIRVTCNLVPVLVEQIHAFVAGERDHFWHLSRRPARGLTTDERRFVLRHFFSCHADTCIRPRPRYRALHDRGGDARDPADFSDADLLDLQVLFNLAWFGFAARVEYPLVSALERKGRDFTEDEKRKLLDLQIAVMRRVLPMYARLAEVEQVELTATPYHHPILPLVIDTESAARCPPDRPRPPQLRAPDDAREHVRRALDAHERTFGRRPSGMWPAEGSVSPEAVALMVDAGVDWIATDESQLWGSCDGLRPADLYRPYRLQLEGHALDVVFRDHSLSDAVGFDYSRMPATDAVDDFVSRVHAAADLMGGRDETPLVVVALDGENPWEYYPGSGFDFLDRLYHVLERDERILTVRLGPHLEANPPKRTLTRLHTGSWIDGDFHIWIGGRVENLAWAALGEAHAVYAERGPDPEAYEHLLTAQASDWFWWYGEPFQSDQDAEFDRLFRGHLRQVHTLLGATPPRALSRTLYPDAKASSVRLPRGLMTPAFAPGPSTWFDWSAAGSLALGSPTASMHRATQPFLRLLYGFDLEHLYLRLEPTPGLDVTGLTLQLVVGDFSADLDLTSVATSLPRAKVHAATPELGVSFEALGAAHGDRLAVTLSLLRDGKELAHYPPLGALEVVVPDHNFEARHWSV